MLSGAQEARDFNGRAARPEDALARRQAPTLSHEPRHAGRGLVSSIEV